MVLLHPQTRHPLIPQAHSLEEDQRLVRQLKDFLEDSFKLLQSKVNEISQQYAEKEKQEAPYHYVRQELDHSPDIQAVNQRRMLFQDNLWKQVSEEIDQDRDRLAQAFDTYFREERLELNRDLQIPTNQLKVNFHRMPGGYLQDGGDDDFWTGVMYDHGVFLYGQGWLGSLNDELGCTLIKNVLSKHYPQFNPQKILDMGCSVGHSTLPYAAEYPQAKVWGIDLGASLLRYANARASALGKEVYFSQQNAENVQFADNSFDLVVSHILMHEVPGRARQRIFAESYRLLEEGGVMVHLDSALFLAPPTLMTRYFRDTEVWVNSEPYLGSSKLEDFQTYALEAGFAPEKFEVFYVPGYYAEQQGNQSPRWVAFCGVK